MLLYLHDPFYNQPCLVIISWECFTATPLLRLRLDYVACKVCFKMYLLTNDYVLGGLPSTECNEGVGRPEEGNFAAYPFYALQSYVTKLTPDSYLALKSHSN